MLAALDSDDDGQTNGQELGDPCGTWSVGKVPDRTTDISLPGTKNSTTADPFTPACPPPGAEIPVGDDDGHGGCGGSARRGDLTWALLIVLGMACRARWCSRFDRSGSFFDAPYPPAPSFDEPQRSNLDRRSRPANTAPVSVTRVVIGFLVGLGVSIVSVYSFLTWAPPQPTDYERHIGTLREATIGYEKPSSKSDPFVYLYLEGDNLRYRINTGRLGSFRDVNGFLQAVSTPGVRIDIGFEAGERQKPRVPPGDGVASVDMRMIAVDGVEYFSFSELQAYDESQKTAFTIMAVIFPLLTLGLGIYLIVLLRRR